MHRRADQHRHMRRERRRLRIERMRRNDRAIEPRLPAEPLVRRSPRTRRDHPILHRRSNLDEARRGNLRQLLKTDALRLQLLQHLSGQRGRSFRTREVQLRAALHDRLVKQSFRRGHRHQRADLRATARLAEDRHVRGIAAEASDVVAHPLQRGHDVEHADIDRARILLAADRRHVQIAEDIEPVIDADDDDIAAAAEILAVVRRQLLRRACLVTAAVQPHHHGPLAAIVGAGRPHVESQAIFAGIAVVPVEQKREPVGGPSAAHWLRADGAVAHRRAHLRPRRDRRRRLKARLARGRACIGNAFERDDAVADEPSDLPRGSFDDRVPGRGDDRRTRVLAHCAECDGRHRARCRSGG